MQIDLSINLPKTTELIVQFIRKVVKNAGFDKVVLGLSGGIDSAVSCTLAVRALGVKHVHVGIFPCGELNKKGEEEALMVANYLAIQSANIHKRDIKNSVDSLGLTLSEFDRLRIGNISARIRMIHLYDLSKKQNALVLGTENKTEHLLGYFTRFGDAASDIEPIQHLYKTQVRQLAHYLKVPKQIIEKAPTAGLWVGQTDEGDFGFSYEQADRILDLFVDKKLNAVEIENEGFQKEIIQKVLDRVERNEFKHKLPYTIK